jgi:hypothetical protein
MAHPIHAVVAVVGVGLLELYRRGRKPGGGTPPEMDYFI